jgi:two-component system response regulator HydG
VLNVLEEKTFRRVGGREALRVDVRLIAATNRDLEQAVVDGTFGADLYYRLNVLPVRLPPLRERGEDVGLLARHFLDQFAREMGKTVRDLTPAAESKLLAHPWPGNVRELRNVIERTVLLTDAEVIDAADLLLGPSAAGPQLVLNVPPTASLDEVERAYCLQTLAQCGGNRTHAAERLGIDRKTLQRKLKEWGVEDSPEVS